MEDNQLSPLQQNKIIKESVTESIQSLFPIQSGGRTLSVSNVRLEDSLSNTDFPAQKEVKLNRKS